MTNDRYKIVSGRKQIGEGQFVYDSWIYDSKDEREVLASRSHALIARCSGFHIKEAFLAEGTYFALKKSGQGKLPFADSTLEMAAAGE